MSSSVWLVRPWGGIDRHLGRFPHVCFTPILIPIFFLITIFEFVSLSRFAGRAVLVDPEQRFGCKG